MNYHYYYHHVESVVFCTVGFTPHMNHIYAIFYENDTCFKEKKLISEAEKNDNQVEYKKSGHDKHKIRFSSFA